MKTALVLALALFAACATDEKSSLGQQNALTTGTCHSNADCPPNDQCVFTTAGTTGGSTTSVPGGVGLCVAKTSVQCEPTAASSTAAGCPQGERCNPICSATGIAGYHCQPDGLPTQMCPIPCDATTTPSGCPQGQYCVELCANTTAGASGYVCIPQGALPPVCH
jgi:hypothetical protein